MKQLNEIQKKRLVEIQTQLAQMLKRNLDMNSISDASDMFAQIISDGATALFEIETMCKDKSDEILQTINALASALFISEKSSQSVDVKLQNKIKIEDKTKIPDFLKTFKK